MVSKGFSNFHERWMKIFFFRMVRNERKIDKGENLQGWLLHDGPWLQEENPVGNLGVEEHTLGTPVAETMPREVPLPLEEQHLLPDPETSYNIAGVGPWEGIVSSRASLPKKVCQSDHAAPLGLRAHATMRTSSQCHGKSVENVRGTFFHIFLVF